MDSHFEGLYGLPIFLREFQLMTSTPDDSSLLSDQDIN